MNEKLDKIRTMKDRISFAMGFVDNSRMNVCFDNEGETLVTINLHFLSGDAVRRMVRNVIAVVRCPFKLRLVHGYNHGTALRDLIMAEPFSTRVTDRCLIDPGTSMLTIAA